MAEVNKTASAPPSTGGTRSGTGFELRLERGGASVRLEQRELAPGLTLELLAIQVPDVQFPFDVGEGASQFRHRLSDLSELAVAATPPFLQATLGRAPLEAAGLLDVRIEVRAGFAELTGRLAAGPPFTLKAGLLAQGELGLRVLFHSGRVFGPAPFPAASLPHFLSRALSGVLGAGGGLDPLGTLLRQVLAPRGWKVPRTAGVRLTRAELTEGAARVGWAHATDGAELRAEPDLLAAEEGIGAFPEVEAAIEAGEYARARELLLGAGSTASGHPFAAERLLSLFLLEEQFHDEALDLAAQWIDRRPGFAPALAAEALIRQARGERQKSGHAWAELARTAAERGEVFTVLAAAEAAFGAPGASPQDALRAVETALSLQRNHVPALRALRVLAAASADRESLLRADRRIVAYDPDPVQKARAHAELGELLREAEPAAARHHLDQALRLAPDDPTALAALARGCAAGGDALRAVRALDRLRELHLARDDRAAAAAAALEAGELWAGPLDHAENALLRYRTAVELAPSPETHARAARAAERVGQWVEAADHHAAVLASLDPGAPGAPALLARTRLALADVAEHRLGDPAGAVAHLETAAILQPEDRAVLRRLVDLHRALRRPDGLAAALDRLAPLSPPAERAALLAEAGEALLVLGQPDAARVRFAAALAHDAFSRPALTGLARLASARGDAVAQRDALSRLLPLATGSAEAAELQDQLAAACERAGDLAGAARAARAARNAISSPARLETELRLLRKAGDTAALSAVLPEAAQLAAAAGDPAQAAALRLEHSRLLAADAPVAALAALAEAAALAPGDPGVLRAQADLAERTGDLRLALGALRALLTTGCGDAPALEVRAARAALAAGELTAAREHAARAEAAGAAGAAELLNEALARTGDGPARAELLVRMGRLEEAAEVLDRIGRPLEAAPLLLRAGRHLDAAAAFQAGGDLGQALSALSRAVENPATAVDALPRLAELRLSGGDPRGAAAALLSLARLRGGRDGARLAWRAHGLDPQPAALDAVIDLDPGFAPARARRAAERAETNPRGALADAEAALGAAEPLATDERRDLLRVAASAADSTGDVPAAHHHLAAYCDLAPEDDEALERLAALQRHRGDAQGLISVLDRRIAKARGPTGAGLRVERAGIALDGGDLPTALRLLEEALELDPESLGALRALTDPPLGETVPARRRAALLASRARHPEAVPDEVSAAHAERARLLSELGEASAALEALRVAASRGSEDDAALELRAALAAAAGIPAEAAAALLRRAERACAGGEPGAADRLAEAGLAALAAGLEGAYAALEAALPLGPGRENARAVRQALVERARAAGDAARERPLLAGLVPLLRTGERPAALLRICELARAAGELAEVRSAAEEARRLAPRDPRAVEAARAAADAEGDLAAVAARLAELAELVPAERARHLLARARLLAFLGKPEEADREYGTAVAMLPPDRQLAEEHLRFRREALPALPAGAPLETYARRVNDPRDAARAFRAAAALALAGGDRAAALRCARRALARTANDLDYAGPLLARILYLGGSSAEALVLHRRLFDAGLHRLPPEEALVLARQLAELAEEAGELELARAALDQVLALRPSDLDAAMRRFALDPDRARAARDLASQADFCRSAARRAEALAAAAEASLGEIGDAPLADLLFRRARDAALRLPARAAEMARRRVDAFRAAEGAQSPVVVEALGEAAEEALKSGDRAEARALLVEATARARDRGQLAAAAEYVARQAALAAEDGESLAAAAHHREAGDLYAWSGMLKEAARELRRSLAIEPTDVEALALLEAVARAQGAEGAPLLIDALEQRISTAEPGPARAELRLALVDAHLLAGGERAKERAEAELQRAYLDDPASPAIVERLGGQATRDAERARHLLEQASRELDAAAGAQLRREAAGLLALSPEPADRTIAAATWAELAAWDPADLEAHRAAARLFREVGQRERTVSHLAALVRADPDDESAARELAEAYSDRHRDRAELFLAQAERAEGDTRAARLREAAKALFAAGEDARARATLLAAFQAWPADDTAFVAALRDATTDVDRIDAVLRARAAAVPGEAAACHRARADALLAFGESDRAVEAYEAALAIAPDDVAALAALAACFSSAGREDEARAVDARLIARAEAEPHAVPPSAEANARFRRGLAAWAAGRPEDGIGDLERALALAPTDERAGVAWAVLALGHASRGDRGLALAAARSRAERALALDLAEERKQALVAGAELSAQLGDEGADAAEILLALVRLRREEGESPEAVAPIAERAAACFSALREPERARQALEIAGLALGQAPEPVPTPVPAAPALPDDPAEAVRVAAERALGADDPVERGAAFLAYAEALATSGAPSDDIRTALDLAVEADPDAPGPWRMRAALETAEGQPAAAARAHLSVSIRSEGETAASAALDAAQLFDQARLPAEAVRALRVAIHASPGCASARTALAEQALATGDADGAAAHLAAIDPESIPAEERSAHARRMARAFEAADRRADAEAVWHAIVKSDPEDAEAFEHAAALAQARGALEAWMELAQVREQALARRGDDQARADLRCARGEVLSSSGRLEAARTAFLSALELIPGHRAATALAELDGRHDEWRRTTDQLSAEVAQAGDPAERAALHLRRSRILLERLADPVAAAMAAEQSLMEARSSRLPAARRTSTEAEALLRQLGQETGVPAPAPPQPPRDGVSAVLRAQAEAARGNERAELFERLAGHLERAGDREGAADALLSALEADPDRELTHSWLRSVAAGDPDRLARAEAIRAGEGPRRTTLHFEPRKPAAIPRAPEPPEVAPLDREGADQELPAEAPGEPFFPPLDLDAPSPSGLEPEATLEFGAPPPADAAAEEPELDLEASSHGGPATSEPAFSLGEPPRDASTSVEPALEFGDSAPPASAAPPESTLEFGVPPPEGSAAASGAEEVPWAPPDALPDLDLDLPVSAIPSVDAASRALAALELELDLERAPASPPGAVPAAALAPQGEASRPDPARTGRGHLEAEEWELAYADLSEAFEAAPGDPELIRDLMRAAEKVGQDERYVQLGEQTVDMLAAQDLVAAAARLRQLAEVVRVRLGDPERAARLLEKALSLVPADPDTQRELASTLASRPRSAPRALESWLAIARQDPSDAGALSSIAALCARAAEDADPAAAARSSELGRVAASLVAFLLPASPEPLPPRHAVRIPAEARDEIAEPPAAGPSARLLALLAPWLEPLFPADLGRRGASSADWLAPPRGPALRGALEAAGRALGSRPHAAFLIQRAGAEVAIENTQPPAMIFSAGVDELPERLLPFLVARTLDLVQRGWALGGKFAPRDVGILLELACRFAGGTAPSLGLPAERAGSYLTALTRTVPSGILDRARLLAPDAAHELATFDPRGFGEAIRRTADRVALLYAGDPGDALRVLALAESGAAGPLAPAQVLALPAPADLARFALSDRFLELRLAVTGG